MQNIDVDKIFTRIKAEMVSAWAYLDAIEQVYENEEGDQIEILIETSPGFFGLVESSLIESAFSRLARLMDPKQSFGEYNLSFDMLCEHCSGCNDFMTICGDFLKIKSEWKNGKYEKLRTYRNKFHSHNDFSILSNAQPLISCRMSKEEVSLLKELFKELWDIVIRLNNRIQDSALLYPSYKDLNMRPVSFFSYLKTGLKVSKALPDHPELYCFINNDC